MLRMEFYRLADCLKLRMEGRFVLDFAEHARMLIRDSMLPSNLIVDLSAVSYVDTVGEKVLLWFKEIGATFTAESAYSQDVCERLQLPQRDRTVGSFAIRPERIRRAYPDSARSYLTSHFEED